MARWLCALLAATCVLADDVVEDRRNKLPYVADAVGNKIPAPSVGPSPVGSPIKLLTPDRYEFYTFDESGELVKRLMTLEEIQAIVAAGEGTEGHLVTFANDDQPNIAFNFSQAPYTKVHNVVTNVQNVLKAQMEAQKKNPPLHTPLDTPDVSDSWSLILPTIFGNTGADIIPDKSSNHAIPETDTFDFDSQSPHVDENSLSKEGSSHILSTSSIATSKYEPTELTTEKAVVTVKVQPTRAETTTTAKTTTTTPKPITTSTTSKPRTTPTTAKPRTTTTTRKLTTSPSKKKPTVTTAATTNTSKPRVTTTAKPLTQSSAATPTSPSPKPSTKVQPGSSTSSSSTTPTEANKVKITPLGFTKPTTVKVTATENPDSFVPISTVTYVTTERSTVNVTESPKTTASSASTTKRSVTTRASTTASPLSTKVKPIVTTYKPVRTTPMPTSAATKETELERIENATTVTTQSVSPSTTVSSTEFMAIERNPQPAEYLTPPNILPPIPIFDVAQSISQIASDLGNPQPTTSDLLDSTKAGESDLESKENLELDIPNDAGLSKKKVTETPENIKESTINFVKITTLDPLANDKPIQDDPIKKDESINKHSFIASTEATSTSTGTTIDPILSESMDNLLSQIVNGKPQNIVPSPDNSKKDEPTIVPALEKDTTPASESTTANILPATDNIIKTSSKAPEEPKQEPNNDEENLFLNKKQETTATQNQINQDKKTSASVNSEKFVQITLTENEGTTTTLATTPKENVISEPEPIQNSNKNESLIENVVIAERIKEETKEPVLSKESSTKQSTTEKQKESFISTKPAFVSTQETTLEVSTTERIQPSHAKDTVKILDAKPKIDEFKKKIQKINIDEKELANDRNSSWKLISTVKPPKANEIPKDKLKNENNMLGDSDEPHKDINLDVSKENQGLEVTTKDLDDDMFQFTQLCNELAFRYWSSMTENIDSKRSFVMSPYSITSMLAMMFMGARGATSGEMNDILKLDDMVTFNPHFTLKNISDSIETSPEAGVMVSAFIRELYSDRNRGKILTFYKERAQHFYNGHVEEINFNLISDIIRRRTNLLVKRYTWGRIQEYMKANSVIMQPPLAAFSTNIFQTDCTGTSVEGRDGEMYFVVSPTVRQRRLVPVPAVVYKKGFLAGYDPVLDATAAALGNTNSIVTTLLLMPGQQGNVVHADDLEALEKRLLDSNPTTPIWNRLLRTLLPRIGLELQIPRFSHKSIFNVSSTLKSMGLKDLFDADEADLGGLNGPSKDLYLSDMVQQTTFATCGEDVIAEQHHIEEYPDRLETRRRRTSRWASAWDEPRDYQRAFHDPHDVGDAMHLPLHLRPRQARLPARNAQPARLKFDRPFLFFVRHNPSGMILYVGRYNPRLLP